MMARSLEEAVIELYYWQYATNPTNFTSKLFELMQKADGENFKRLCAAFPEESNALILWMEAPDQNEFFKEWGLNMPKIMEVISADLR